ncbi:uncharacterized protein LOC141656831 [Silene latifolia]|uniref:uncharacterized protein LOC141656831 n=1 Tax=Silene latifolia TaxID=37657 RepID=UPI003D786B86
MGCSRLISSLDSKFTLFLLLVIITLILKTVVTGQSFDSLGNETDHTALLAIKSRLVDRPNGVLRSWNNSIHHCDWEGVTCGRNNNRVIALELYSRGLAGTVSPFIGNLTFLRDIKLYNNSLSGEIHPEFGRLFGLQKLDLENNTFVGKIPANLTRCINLRYFSVAGNKLEGELPKEFGTLSRLEVLYIQHNTLSGPVFDVITNLTSLKFLSASSNSFTGTIPSSIGRLRNLTKLYAALNNLSGIIPSSLFNLTSLREIVLANNLLQGPLPADASLTFPRLTELNIAQNNFSGEIPLAIWNLTSLEYISVEENQFTGQVPRDFGRHQNLDSLLLYRNYFAGDINVITTLVNCSKLTRLDLRYNNFTGTLPETVANLSTTLVWLALGYSPIKGVMPAGITNLINLKDLEISTTLVAGSIPQDISKLQKLEWVNLGFNRLTGNIPDSFGNISRLSGLYLDNNRLEGSIPPNLGYSQNLLYLYLSNNELNGTLGKELFGGSAKFLELGLSHNQLHGSIPVEIRQQKNLQLFYASENKLSGVIPEGLGNCLDLQYLDLHGNNLHGDIPETFSALGGLQAIDLSRNNLSGLLPPYFSKFPLLYLNFSDNDFEGAVPTTGVFTNVSAVSLAGNTGLCGGVPELHLPKCIQQNQRKKKTRISGTIIILSAFGGVLIMATGLYCLYMTCRGKYRKSVSSGSVKKEASSNVSYNMLLKATDNFSAENLLGAGHFGSVFKGILNGNTVAVKVLNLQQHGASKSFMAECRALRNIRHRNLVGIITACSSMDFQQNDFKALVYEFMPNGNLDTWLHETDNLSLIQRVDIAIDVAHALNYLHHECEIPIVHCDLKPSNILLDSDMVSRVGDFGLAKFLAEPQLLDQSSTVGIRGTVGYVAPEYGLGSEASTEGDLYSYGILLLELMTGKRPTDATFKENISLHMYVEAALPDNVLQIVDSTLADEEIVEEVEDHKAIQEAHQRKLECIVSVVNIGLACSNHLPQRRMKITDAITRLRAVKENLVNVRQKRK